jgi:hypothetical protein
MNYVKYRTFPDDWSAETDEFSQTTTLQKERAERLGVTAAEVQSLDL